MLRASTYHRVMSSLGTDIYARASEMSSPGDILTPRSSWMARTPEAKVLGPDFEIFHPRFFGSLRQKVVCRFA